MPVPARPHVILVVILGVAGVAAGILVVPRGRIPFAAEPSAPATPSPAEQQHAATHARYAAARLHLAQANLAKAADLARTVPGQVAEQELASLRRRVAMLQRHVDTTTKLPHGNSAALARAAAQAAARAADDDLMAAQAVRRRQEATISPFAMAQLEAAAELARARLELWNDPSFLDSPLQVMQMQIDQLSDDLFDLVYRVDNTPALDRR